ncbi:MAG: hypothetical protein PHQ34_15135, partial [Methanothrix sp.]|nr:hypothetical protein [Methanothrix sp.]
MLCRNLQNFFPLFIPEIFDKHKSLLAVQGDQSFDPVGYIAATFDPQARPSPRTRALACARIRASPPGGRRLWPRLASATSGTTPRPEWLRPSSVPGGR